MAACLSAWSSHLEPLRARPERAFAGGLVVAGALAGPGSELAGGREDAHVGADLGDDRLGGACFDAGDRTQKLNGRCERVQLLLDRLGEPVDLLVQEVEVGQDGADQDGV